MCFRLVQKSMTLKGLMAIILRYFAEFGGFRGQLRKSGWLAINRFSPEKCHKVHQLTWSKHDGRAVLFAVAKLLVSSVAAVTYAWCTHHAHANINITLLIAMRCSLHDTARSLQFVNVGQYFLNAPRIHPLIVGLVICSALKLDCEISLGLALS